MVAAAAIAHGILKIFTTAQQRGSYVKKSMDAYAKNIKDGFACLQSLMEPHIRDG